MYLLDGLGLSDDLRGLLDSGDLLDVLVLSRALVTGVALACAHTAHHTHTTATAHRTGEHVRLANELPPRRVARRARAIAGARATATGAAAAQAQPRRGPMPIVTGPGKAVKSNITT